MQGESAPKGLEARLREGTAEAHKHGERAAFIQRSFQASSGRHRRVVRPPTRRSYQTAANPLAETPAKPAGRDAREAAGRDAGRAGARRRTVELCVLGGRQVLLETIEGMDPNPHRDLRESGRDSWRYGSGLAAWPLALGCSTQNRRGADEYALPRTRAPPFPARAGLPI
jgi:hypothetical protein